MIFIGGALPDVDFIVTLKAVLRSPIIFKCTLFSKTTILLFLCKLFLLAPDLYQPVLPRVVPFRLTALN